MMVMPKKSGKYRSIAEIRSSFYPGSAGMLSLEKKELFDLPSSLADKSHLTMEGVDNGDTESQATGSGAEESHSDEP